MHDVVAGTQRIVFGVEEGHHPRALVIMQPVAHQRHRTGKSRYHPRHDHFPAQPGQEDHHQAGGPGQHGGAQIRLFGDQARRYGDYQHRNDHAAGR